MLQKITTPNHRALLYLYLSMVHKPWVGRLNLHFFTLFLGGPPIDLTYYQSRSTHPTDSFPYLYPKLWALCPMTIMQGFCYPTCIPCCQWNDWVHILPSTITIFSTFYKLWETLGQISSTYAYHPTHPMHVHSYQGMSTTFTFSHLHQLVVGPIVSQSSY